MKIAAAGWEALFADRLRLEEGYIRFPETPGIGLGLDRKAADRLRV
jgi:L-alanine-DL-glutamate epimerase-like enolase superfamily enzyme